MVCQRCRGFLVCEMFNELGNDTDSLYTRCINCGGIEDAIVRANRVRPLGEMPGTPRAKIKKTDRRRVAAYVDG